MHAVAPQIGGVAR